MPLVTVALFSPTCHDDAHLLYSTDARFSDTEALENDDGFPKAFYTFLMYLYTNRCDRLTAALNTPVQKADRTPRK